MSPPLVVLWCKYTWILKMQLLLAKHFKQLSQKVTGKQKSRKEWMQEPLQGTTYLYAE